MIGAKRSQVDRNPTDNPIGWVHNGMRAMQGKRYPQIDGSQERPRQKTGSCREECGTVISLMMQLGTRWSEDQRVAHLRDLLAVNAYRPNADRMAEAFMIKAQQRDLLSRV